MRHVVRISALAIVCAAAGLAAGIEAGGDWPLFGGSPQRDGWAREEKVLSRQNVAGLKLKWKLRIASTPREMNNLTAPVLAGGSVIVAGASDTLDVIDAASGR